MIPHRFATEYPERCLALLDASEPIARQKKLLASFALLAAASVLVIPYERLRTKATFERERGSSLSSALRDLRKVSWPLALFWNGQDPGDWRFSRVVGRPDDVAGWRNEDGQPSVSSDANRIVRKTADDVLRVLRNALAHGNVVYLNKDGDEQPGTPVARLAFLSRYEETAAQKAGSNTYRLVTVSDEAFLSFLRCWATWLTTFPLDSRLAEAA